MRLGQKLPTDPKEIDGPTKAAVLMLMLDQDSAGGLIRELPMEMVEEVMRVLVSIESVPGELGQSIVNEFYELTISSGVLKEGGLDYAKTLLRDSLDPKTAEKLFEDIRRGAQKAPFAFLQKAESENILTFIQEEHPQTIALIVSHLPHHKASEVLVGLPPEKQIEVVQRVAGMEQTNPAIIQEVESGLESRLSNMLVHSVDRVGGTSTVAEILNLCDRQTERSIMDGMESEHPDLAEEVRRLMFVFEDILLVDDKGIQTVLKEIDNEELCLALKTASEELQQKIYTNMSTRAAEVIQEDMEYMGPVRVSDVEAAQQRIVDIVRRLEDSGDIVISGRGGTQDVVV
jgi:flagellar motor switch protein FliG